MIPDLVNRDFTAEVPGQKMVGDITHIPTWEGWLYLATVIDCATWKVAGWAMAGHYRTPLITETITMAVRNMDLPADAVFTRIAAAITLPASSPPYSGTWLSASLSAGLVSALTMRASRVLQCGG